MGISIKNLAAVIIYFAGAHIFDALYVFTSKEFSYFTAMGIMFLVLAGVSAVLVSSHGRVKAKNGWDALGLDHLNQLRDENDIPPSKVGKRFKRWCMRRRLTIFVFGSCLIGPPVVTILLRKPGSLPDSIFYILSGTLISVVTWVTVWKGFWSVWALYIKPVISWAA